MSIRNVSPKGKKPRFALYFNNKFVQHIGNAKALERYLKDIERLERKKQELTQSTTVPPLPPGKYDVIYADPPWRYDFDVESRATENHYPTLLVKDICRLRDRNKVRIQEKFDDNAVLYLWATAPKLNEAFDVIRAWGFTYKTNMVWVKDKIGLGWYCRNQHELLLIAEKGEMPLPASDVRPCSVMNYPRTTHSTKPPEIYREIERWYPGRRYFEVFGVKNATRPNCWGVFGNDVYE